MATHAVEVVYRGIFQRTLARNIVRQIVFAARKDGKIGTAFGRYSDSPERNGIPAKQFAVVCVTALELEESLILCNTGLDHHSGNIHKDQKETMSSDAIKEMVKANVELSFQTRNYLLRGDLAKFGECLDKAWRLKRNFSSMISNDHIDSIYEGALKHGAIGGKLLGAGGGGFFIFYVAPFKKHALIRYLKSKSLIIQPFRFEADGLKTWVSRETHNTEIGKTQQ